MQAHLQRIIVAAALVGVAIFAPPSASFAQQRAAPAAVQASTTFHGLSEPGLRGTPSILGAPVEEVEPNNLVEEAQVLVGTPPLVVHGAAEVDDEGDVQLRDSDGNLIDDIEDLYIVELTQPGLTASLTGLEADCDLFLIDLEITTILGFAVEIGVVDEEMVLDEIPAGTYILGVTIYDQDPGPVTETPYVLTVNGAIPTATVAARDLPEGFALEQNYPNPFNPETTIRYSVSSATRVRLEIYDMVGRIVRTLIQGDHAPGTYTVRWDGRSDDGGSAASGAYIYRLQADGVATARTLLLVR